MPNVLATDPVWLGAYTDVFHWLDDEHNTVVHAEATAYRNVLTTGGRLSADQTAAVQRLMSIQQNRPEDDTAGEHDAWQIPNGVFEVTTSGESLRFNVHLVREGTLAGKRVVKIWHEGRFKAFAFLTWKGELKIWARFAGDAEASYVVAAKALLSILRDQGRAAAFSYRELSDNVGGQAYNVEFTPRCARCNRAVTIAAGGYCANCGEGNPAEYIRVTERYDPYEADRAARAARLRQEREERQAREREERRTNRIMSEITPGEVR